MPSNDALTQWGRIMSQEKVMSQCLVSGPSERATQVSQCCKIPITLIERVVRFSNVSRDGA